MRKINVADITLKKLSEDRAVSLLFREKSAIANCADRLGADCIELPAIKNFREDSIIYKTIAKNIQNATLVIPVGFNKDEVSFAWECIKDAKSPRLQVELPISTIQMEYTYHVKQSKMLEKINELVSAAKALCDDVEFSALDATRADDEFIIASAKEAENCGASIITGQNMMSLKKLAIGKNSAQVNMRCTVMVAKAGGSSSKVSLPKAVAKATPQRKKLKLVLYFFAGLSILTLMSPMVADRTTHWKRPSKASSQRLFQILKIF